MKDTRVEKLKYDFGKPNFIQRKGMKEGKRDCYFQFNIVFDWSADCLDASATAILS